MKLSSRWIAVILIIIAVVPLAACGPRGVSYEKVEPFTLEPVDGSDFKRVVLTEKAEKRLDIQTVQVRMDEVDGSQYMVIPYSAVMYGLKGETWAYTNPEPLVYVRESIVVDRIEGEQALLMEGLDTTTKVVTVGAPLLYGAEVGVSK